MNILALTKYAYEGPSSRYRFYNYQECFKANGIDMTIAPLFASGYLSAGGKLAKVAYGLGGYFQRKMQLVGLLLSPKRYDMVLIEYELFPYLPAWFETLLHKRGVRYIVDYDDAIFHKYDMSSNQIIHRLLKNKIAKVMQHAEHVIVCNAYLEDYAKQVNVHTFRLPTVVMLEKYIKEMEDFQQEDTMFVIGWIGSRTTSVYVLELLPVMKSFVEVYPNVRFDLVGFDRSLLMPEEQEQHHINIIEWKEETEIQNILAFDVGIMPLHDDAWSRGKCGFKLVQYMTCKKPVIASPVGMNCVLVREGENGFLVRDKEEWFNAFEKLYLDEALRAKMAENNFIKIENEYNHHTNCQRYVALLQTVLKERRC